MNLIEVVYRTSHWYSLNSYIKVSFNQVAFKVRETTFFIYGSTVSCGADCAAGEKISSSVCAVVDSNNCRIQIHAAATAATTVNVAYHDCRRHERINGSRNPYLHLVAVAAYHLLVVVKCYVVTAKIQHLLLLHRVCMTAAAGSLEGSALMMVCFERNLTAEDSGL